MTPQSPIAKFNSRVQVAWYVYRDFNNWKMWQAKVHVYWEQSQTVQFKIQTACALNVFLPKPLHLADWVVPSVNQIANFARLMQQPLYVLNVQTDMK